ncbi:hypothetical protein [Bdellovibrio sp. GT3]|uniref:hypothetical protein n=1 Tax=Bdellovibrio sp. GT3 TaxID=3136282 RepID=UPI0030EFE4F3
MKQVFCALLMLGLSSTAFAAKPYYICNLKNVGDAVQADAEILVQFNGNQIAIKGAGATGTCIGAVKWMGSDGHYGADFTYSKANQGCQAYNNVQWFSTNQGFADIHPNSTVALDQTYAPGVWARYTCK